MRLWVVNHGTDREWLKVRIKTPANESPRDAFVFGEWNSSRSDEGHGYMVPRLPRAGPWPNTDPLVIGDNFFLSYCMKGRKSSLTNLLDPNSLEAGDLVLCGGQRRGRVIVDTVLVVGEHRVWPSDPAGTPGWETDPIAARVHFHDAAHHAPQHPEVHSPRAVRGRSYRGRRWDESQDMFSWVPGYDRVVAPLSIGPEDEVYKTWFGLYSKPAQSYFQTLFPVIRDLPPDKGKAIFDGLIAKAAKERFHVATRVDLIPEPA